MNRAAAFLFTTIVLTLTAIPSIAQPPDTLWTRTLGPNDPDGYAYGNSVRQTADGGFIVTGGGYSTAPGTDEEIWLIKTDVDGIEVWNSYFGTPAFDFGTCVQQTADGGYIVCGTENGMDHANVLWLIKTDVNGNEEWIQTLGVEPWEEIDGGNWVEQTPDGGYIVTGFTEIPGNWTDMWLFKIDSEGTVLWEQTYGEGFYLDRGICVSITSDGGYIVVGVTESFGAGNSDIWLIKTDDLGNEVWNRTFGGISGDEGYEVQETSDGGYIITGSTRNNDNTDAWLIKTDSEGNEVWLRNFGGPDGDYAKSVQQTADGGYVITGSTSSFGAGGQDVWVIKTDSEGIELWSHTFGGDDVDVGHSIRQTADGGYVICGKTRSFGVHNESVWLIRLAPDGPQLLVTISLTPHNMPIQIPADGGSFTFDVVSTNTLTEPIIGQAWTVVELPNGRNYVGPELLRVSLVFEPGVTITQTNLVQFIPGFAPAGNYIYKGRVGFYPNDIYAQDSFEFYKMGVAGGSQDDQGWTTSGWNVDEDQTVVAIPSEYAIESIYPNPFNPTTTVSLSLPTDSELSVRVFNTVGQEVAVLADSRFAAGQHQFTFDGSGLSSGIYFVQASVPGAMSEMQKVVMLK